MFLLLHSNIDRLVDIYRSAYQVLQLNITDFMTECHNLCYVTGLEGGLELILNVEQYENVPDMANNIGVRVSN